MKNYLRLLLVPAAILAVAGHCSAASQVTMDLTGQVLRSGSTLKVSSTNAIDKSTVYYYSISGTLGTSSKLSVLLPPSGTGSLEELFTIVDPQLVPYLAGYVLNPSGRLPYTCVNALKEGSLTISNSNSLLDGITIFGKARLKTGIKGDGIVYAEITNVSFGIRRFPHGPTITDGTDSFTFDSGQVVVHTNPSVGTYQPDLSFVLNNMVYGVGVTGTDPSSDDEGFAGALAPGEATTVPVNLQNIGSQPDTFQLTATPVADGWSQTFIYNGKNVTAAVTSSGGFTIPPPGVNNTPQPLPPGGVVSFTWQIKNVDSFSGSTQNEINAASNGDSTKQDAISDFEFAQ